MQSFKNEPLTDFTKSENKKAMEDALVKVRTEFGKKYPVVIGGEKIETNEFINSINPSNSDEVVGYTSKLDETLAKRAVDVAYAKFNEWKKIGPEKRADYLFRAAKLMRERKHEFSAWMIYEEGKNWVEADADTAEAIDFLDFYAREALRYSEKQPLTKLEGEDNRLEYIPLGVGVVIPPWNFPLAILVGMTSASIVSGNTVVLKPSSDSTVIGYKFYELMEEVGLPAGVLNFCPGAGSKIGNTLVAHPKTRFITFTGSKEVGLKINELAAKTPPEQIWIKRVVAEMGGKDTIVVDGTADLDKAAEGIVGSAFGFQGQKCSACSRAVVTEDVYDKVLEKSIALTKAINVDESFKNPRMGPVINKKSYDSIFEYIEIGKKEGRIVFGGDKTSGNGYFIEPTIIADIDPMARISQEEIFGPVLAFVKAKDFNHALQVANNTEYGLTGAVYSTNRENLEKARTEFHVGNLYFNRKCTAALVGAHPFGGFNMSGTDSKAGGRDYLALFLQAKCVSEKKG